MLPILPLGSRPAGVRVEVLRPIQLIRVIDRRSRLPARQSLRAAGDGGRLFTYELLRCDLELMAGSPMKAKMRVDLERRTRERFPDEPELTHLDYVADWQSAGKTLRSLCHELGVSPPMLSNYLRLTYGSDTVREILTRARETGAHQLVEESLELADAEMLTPAATQRARLQVSTRQWVAERWNRAELGQPKAGTTVNIGTLMLQALQAPIPSAAAIPGAIAQDAEILSLEPATSSEPEQ